jgi:MFS family permease
MVCGRMSYFNRAVQIVFFAGNLVGVLSVGPFSDWYGRKTAYMTCLTIWIVTTLIGYFMENPYGWIVTRFVAGAVSLGYNTAASVYRYCSTLIIAYTCFLRSECIL